VSFNPRYTNHGEMSESKRIPYASPARPPASLLGLSKRVATANKRKLRNLTLQRPTFYDPLFCQWNLTQTPYCCVVFVFFFYVISDKRFVSMLFIVCGLNHFCFSYSLWSFISCKKASHSLLSPMITPSHRQWCDGGSDNKKKHKICPYQKHTPLRDLNTARGS